jgi:hypothetical protein
MFCSSDLSLERLKILLNSINHYGKFARVCQVPFVMFRIWQLALLAVPLDLHLRQSLLFF